MSSDANAKVTDIAVLPTETPTATGATRTHTPGPWCTDPDAAQFFNVFATDGRLVAVLFGHDAGANARLIAAAPKLLEALQRLLAVADRWHVAGDFHAAAAAVADATGAA